MHDTTGPKAAGGPVATPGTGGATGGIAYRITVKGAVDEQWSAWFDGLQVSRAGEDTTLAGSVRDQAALHGLLARVRDLGLTLIAVEPAVDVPAPSGTDEAFSAPRRRAAWRSTAVAAAASVAAGFALAAAVVVALLTIAPESASEPTITGTVLMSLAAGWALLARSVPAARRWARVPAASLGIAGAGLLVFQPGPEALDALAWLWPLPVAGLGVWASVRIHGSGLGRGAWLLYSAALVLIAAGMAGAVTAVATLSSGTPSQPGQLVDVGGRRLYLECHGAGGPVVILEAGLGGSAADWSAVAGSVAPTTTVCAYDRAGHGWSDPVEGKQDGSAIAADLHELLERAQVPGPYVLVGHSSGASYIRVFAARYPMAVAGMVFLDGQPAGAFSALPDYPGFYALYRAVMGLAPSLSRVGAGLLVGSPADPSGVRTARSMRDEVRALQGTLAEAGVRTTVGDMPVIVLSAGSDQQEGWLEAQAELVRLSENHAHRVLPSATHSSVLIGADAASSARAILDIVAAVRTGTPVR